MNTPDEAQKRYPLNHIVDDPFGATGEAESDPYGYEEYAQRAFIAGAEWARNETLDDAMSRVHTVTMKSGILANAITDLELEWMKHEATG